MKINIMINFLKNFYLHKYQPIVYAISVARAEYEKAGAFISPGLLVLAALKLYFNIPTWVLPVGLIVITFTGYWIGKFLIVMGVPKKTAELNNQQNPQITEILRILKNED